MATPKPTEAMIEGGGQSIIRLQLMSDLHLETPHMLPMYTSFNVEPKCPYLALLGDIGSAYDGRLFSFLEEQLEQFEIVFYVLGNHEPYQLEVSPKSLMREDAIAAMEKFEADIRARREGSIGGFSLGRFVFLDRRRYDINDKVTILGCTLFSHIIESQKSTVSLFVSDFSNIPAWTVDAHNEAHKADLAWLNGQVESVSRDEPHRTIAILTHYSPTALPEANDPEHAEDNRGVQSAFVTDLSGEVCWTSPLVKLWGFGHTHFNCDFVEQGAGKRIVANQRGYGREDKFDFYVDKVVELGHGRQAG
ncbi:related to Ser/Thr protein phosphatase superfamily [Cephalotrichum gorgonifer]|uniref:Related to Ser/Thr protein phosphatase superfamily n=1 Tax=Cephalotrichum gorgonifer TaxID=2041049 RepID=A0AAE8SWS5_9PEZI|nr:related to Ser/Thr protein phosphatase superfamily [Cephalotrichum gorgonifer]